MPMLGGLFGGRAEQHPNFERIAHALHSHLGLETVSPPAEVLAIIDQMTSRELLNFDNMQSAQGMQALFGAKSVHASVDAETKTVTLSLATVEDAAVEAQAEAARRPVFHVGAHHAALHVERPRDLMSAIQPPSSAAARAAGPVVPLPPAFEHLEAFERLLPQLMDLLLRNGRLNSADKEVLKKIRPVDSTLGSRLTALERWQAEVTRRVRGVSVPKASQHLTLGGGAANSAVSEDVAARRFDSLLAWTSKLIKAIENEGAKFHNKPMWLPH